MLICSGILRIREMLHSTDNCGTKAVHTPLHYYFLVVWAAGALG